MFSEESYVPQPQIELAGMFTKIIVSFLLCHNDTIYKEWLISINYFKQKSMHKHNFGQNLKLQSLVS